MGLTQIKEEKDLQDVLQKEEAFLLFKHSNTCPISARAYEQYQRYLEEYPEINGYFLTVQESRPLSNAIAERYAIKHESPQIFYISNGEVKWHAQHLEITKEAIEEVGLK